MLIPYPFALYSICFFPARCAQPLRPPAVVRLVFMLLGLAPETTFHFHQRITLGHIRIEVNFNQLTGSSLLMCQPFALQAKVAVLMRSPAMVACGLVNVAGRRTAAQAPQST